MNPETFCDSLLAHWPGALFRQRGDLTCAWASPGLAEFTGLPPQRWQQEPAWFRQVVHEDDVEKVQAHLDLCRQLPFGQNFCFRVRHADTARVRFISEYRCRVHEKGQFAGFDCVWLDGAQTAAAEKRFAAASWKETVGLMTMALAHDYNNVLAGTQSFTELYLAQIDASHPFHEGLTLIRQNAHKGAAIIQRIVQLHQAKFGQPAYHDLNAVLKETLDLLRKAIPGRVCLTTRLSPDALPIFVDALELRQVIGNLALNAAEAMPDGGDLVFATARRTEPPNLGYFAGVAPGLPCICLEVSDTGCGIAPADLHRLFDPFFTTKFANQGTGLGLHTARFFAERHRGAVSVESLGGAGATFRLWLPQADFTETESLLEFARRRPRRLLLAGGSATALKAMAGFWREKNYAVVIGHADAEAILLSGEPSFDALLLAVEPGDAQPLALATRVRRQKLPLKIIVFNAGGRSEDVEAQFFGKADLVLPPDLPPDEAGRKVSALLE